MLQVISVQLENKPGALMRVTSGAGLLACAGGAVDLRR
jgi:hypothetical protein